MLRGSIGGLALCLSFAAFLPAPAGGESRATEQLPVAAILTGGSSVLIADARDSETIRRPQIPGSAWSRVLRRMAFVDGGFPFTDLPRQFGRFMAGELVKLQLVC